MMFVFSEYIPLRAFFGPSINVFPRQVRHHEIILDNIPSATLKGVKIGGWDPAAILDGPGD